MSELVQEGNIFILYIPVSFLIPKVEEINRLLDIVERHEGPTALIIASKHPKIFSGGMDWKYMEKLGHGHGLPIFAHLMRLYGRLLSFKVPTIGAINGHAIAGGFMLSQSLDYRIMAKGSFNMKMPELALKLVLPRGGAALLATKLSPAVFRDLILKGKTYTNEEAFAKNIIDELVEPQDLMRRAREVANELSSLGDKKDVYQCVKKSIYHDAVNINLKAEIRDEEWKAMNMEVPKL